MLDLCRLCNTYKQWLPCAIGGNDVSVAQTSVQALPTNMDKMVVLKLATFWRSFWKPQISPKTLHARRQEAQNVKDVFRNINIYVALCTRIWVFLKLWLYLCSFRQHANWFFRSLIQEPFGKLFPGCRFSGNSASCLVFTYVCLWRQVKGKSIHSRVNSKTFPVVMFWSGMCLGYVKKCEILLWISERQCSDSVGYRQQAAY